MSWEKTKIGDHCEITLNIPILACRSIVQKK